MHINVFKIVNLTVKVIRAWGDHSTLWLWSFKTQISIGEASCLNLWRTLCKKKSYITLTVKFTILTTLMCIWLEHNKCNEHFSQNINANQFSSLNNPNKDTQLWNCLNYLDLFGLSTNLFSTLSNTTTFDFVFSMFLNLSLEIIKSNNRFGNHRSIS